MSSSNDFAITLQREHQRLGAILRTIAGSPEWARGVPNSLDMSALHRKTELIRAAVDDIERLVTQLG